MFLIWDQCMQLTSHPLGFSCRCRKDASTKYFISSLWRSRTRSGMEKAIKKHLVDLNHCISNHFTSEWGRLFLFNKMFHVCSAYLAGWYDRVLGLQATAIRIIPACCKWGWILFLFTLERWPRICELFEGFSQMIMGTAGITFLSLLPRSESTLSGSVFPAGEPRV